MQVRIKNFSANFNLILNSTYFFCCSLSCCWFFNFSEQKYSAFSWDIRNELQSRFQYWKKISSKAWSELDLKVCLKISESEAIIVFKMFCSSSTSAIQPILCGPSHSIVMVCLWHGLSQRTVVMYVLVIQSCVQELDSGVPSGSSILFVKYGLEIDAKLCM